MIDSWKNYVIGVFNGVSFFFDMITYLPWCLLDSPAKRLLESKRVKARPVCGGTTGTVYRSVEALESLDLEEQPFPDCHTVDDAFKLALKKFSSLPCVGTRRVLEEEDELQPNGKCFKKDVLGVYEWLTYEETESQIENIGRGFQSLGLISRESVVCIYAETRAEWMIVALACFRFNYPGLEFANIKLTLSTPAVYTFIMTLYSTLGEEAIIHAVNETKASVVVTSAELLPKFYKLIPRLSELRHLVYMSPRIPSSAPADHFPATVAVQSLSCLESLGVKAVSHVDGLNGRAKKPESGDLAVIMYTSGSTGVPKGVMISHYNLLSAMKGQASRAKNVGPDDIYIGYLPLAHVLELTAELVCICKGARIGYSSPNTLSDQSTRIKRGCQGDATVLRPTLMAAVPVIMDRILKGILSKVSKGSFLQQALFEFAYNYKLRQYEAGYDTPVLNRLIFNKIRRMLGGRLRLLMSGGASLSADSQTFIRVCFCCPVGQGYGLTETCGAGTVQEEPDRSAGRVGAPLTCNDVKLVDWPEGSYTINDKPYPRGEVWIGGGNVTLGYYRNPEKTAGDFYVDGEGKRWFATGDIGEIHEDGCLKIIDRKKDLVKLSGGEYVALGSIETSLKLCSVVDNICVCAHSDYMFVVCIAVPNQSNVLTLIKDIKDLDINLPWKELCTNSTVIQLVLKSIQQFATKEKFQKIEVPQAVKLCSDPWTPDSGFITDTYKIKRRVIEAQYKDDIERLFKSCKH